MTAPPDPLALSPQAQATLAERAAWLPVWIALADAAAGPGGIDSHAVAALSGALLVRVLAAGPLGVAPLGVAPVAIERRRALQAQAARDLTRALARLAVQPLPDLAPVETPLVAADPGAIASLVTPARLDQVLGAVAALAPAHRAPGALAGWLTHQLAVAAMARQAAARLPEGDGAALARPGDGAARARQGDGAAWLGLVLAGMSA